MLPGRASEQPSSGRRQPHEASGCESNEEGSIVRALTVCEELSSTVEAVRIPVGALLCDLAAVADQEAAGTGELVRLAREHPDRQLLVREVGAGQLERLRGLGLVLVDLAGVLVVTTGLELLDAVFVELFVGLAWGVVVSRHLVPRRHLSCPGSAGSADGQRMCTTCGSVRGAASWAGAEPMLPRTLQRLAAQKIPGPVRVLRPAAEPADTGPGGPGRAGSRSSPARSRTSPPDRPRRPGVPDPRRGRRPRVPAAGRPARPRR